MSLSPDQAPRQRINSWLAHADHASAENLKRQVLSEVVFRRLAEVDSKVLSAVAI